MTDPVERLRRPQYSPGTKSLADEAADEIERLQARCVELGRERDAYRDAATARDFNEDTLKARVADLELGLRYYAVGGHLALDDSWDTVSGEPENLPIYTGLVAERGRQIAGLERELAALAEDDEVTRRLRALTPSVFRDLIESKEPAALVLSLVERIIVGPDLAGTILYRQAGAVSVASPRVRDRYGSGLERRFNLAA